MIILMVRMMAIGAIILNCTLQKRRDGRFFFDQDRKNNPGVVVVGGCCVVEDLLDPPERRATIHLRTSRKVQKSRRWCAFVGAAPL